MESINGSLRRLQTDYVDLYQAHRYDYETPLEETMQAFADVVRAGKAHYIGVSEWTADADPRGARARPRAAASRSSPTSRSTRCCGGSSRPRSCPPCEELGIGQIVWSPIAQGVLTGKYLPGPAAAGGLPGHRREAAAPVHRALHDATTCSTRVQQLKPLAERGRADHGPARRGLGAAEPERVRRRSSAPPGRSRCSDNVKAAGVKLDADAAEGASTRSLDPVVERDPAKTQSPAGAAGNPVLPALGPRPPRRRVGRTDVRGVFNQRKLLVSRRRVGSVTS